MFPGIGMKSPSGVDHDIPVSNSLTTMAVIDLPSPCPLPLVYIVTESWIFCKKERDCGVFYAGCANGSSLPGSFPLKELRVVHRLLEISSLLTACLSPHHPLRPL